MGFGRYLGGYLIITIGVFVLIAGFFSMYILSIEEYAGGGTGNAPVIIGIVLIVIAGIMIVKGRYDILRERRTREVKKAD